MVQSQSTHTSSSGCAVGGGLDDRFDFILISNNVKYGNKKVKYVPGSFHVVGQDGKHFNEAVNSAPTNTSVPANVLSALYNNSDHLPVTLKITVNQPLGIPQMHSDINQLRFTNPVNNILNLKVDAAKTISSAGPEGYATEIFYFQRKFTTDHGCEQPDQWALYPAFYGIQRT